jgi:hypothetical protein
MHNSGLKFVDNRPVDKAVFRTQLFLRYGTTPALLSDRVMILCTLWCSRPAKGYPQMGGSLALISFTEKL